MTTFERNDRAVLVVLDRVDEVLLREEDGRVHHREYALGDLDAEHLGRQARQREQAALGHVVADGLERGQEEVDRREDHVDHEDDGADRCGEVRERVELIWL